MNLPIAVRLLERYSGVALSGAIPEEWFNRDDFGSLIDLVAAAMGIKASELVADIEQSLRSPKLDAIIGLLNAYSPDSWQPGDDEPGSWSRDIGDGLTLLHLVANAVGETQVDIRKILSLPAPRKFRGRTKVSREQRNTLYNLAVQAIRQRGILRGRDIHELAIQEGLTDFIKDRADKSTRINTRWSAILRRLAKEGIAEPSAKRGGGSYYKLIEPEPPSVPPEVDIELPEQAPPAPPSPPKPPRPRGRTKPQVKIKKSDLREILEGLVEDSTDTLTLEEIRDYLDEWDVTKEDAPKDLIDELLAGMGVIYSRGAYQLPSETEESEEEDEDEGGKKLGWSDQIYRSGGDPADRLQRIIDAHGGIPLRSGNKQIWEFPRDKGIPGEKRTPTAKTPSDFRAALNGLSDMRKLLKKWGLWNLGEDTAQKPERRRPTNTITVEGSIPQFVIDEMKRSGGIREGKVWTFGDVATADYFHNKITGIQSDEASDAGPQRHVLVMGGMWKDIPQWAQDNFVIEHIERSSKKVRSQELANQPDLIIVMRRFASHNLYNSAKDIAADVNVPLLAASNWSEVIKLSQQNNVLWFYKIAIENRRRRLRRYNPSSSRRYGVRRPKRRRIRRARA